MIYLFSKTQFVPYTHYYHHNGKVIRCFGHKDTKLGRVLDEYGLSESSSFHYFEKLIIPDKLYIMNDLYPGDQIWKEQLEIIIFKTIIERLL
jgi:hypothetical protein